MSGTASLLDLLRQTPRIQVAFDAKPPSNDQRFFPRRMFDLADIPKRARPVFGESAMIQTLEIRLDLRHIRALHSSIGDRKRRIQTRMFALAKPATAAAIAIL